MSRSLAVAGLLAVACVACAAAPVRDTLTYVMRVDATSPRDAGRIVVGTPLREGADPWARFLARVDAHCSQVEGIVFERITIATRPLAPLETLFDDFVLLSVRPAASVGDDPWSRAGAHDVARGGDPSGVSFRLDEILSGSWRGEGELLLQLLAATAPGIDGRLPFDLVVEMVVSGRCAVPL